MTTFTVTTLVDESNAGATEAAPGGTGLSLREAVALANVTPGNDLILFAENLSGILRLTQGEIEVADSVTIDGGGAITVSGDRLSNDFADPAGVTDVEASARTLGDNRRLFDLAASADGSTLRGLTLTGGRTEGAGETGGALRAAGAVTLEAITVAGNSTGGFFASGGGVFGGSVTLIDSTFHGNATNGYASPGGAVAGGALLLVNATIAGNRTTGLTSDGGGVSGDVVRLVNSTITANAAANTGNGGSTGGGVVFSERLETSDSLILGNRGAETSDRTSDEILALQSGALFTDGTTLVGSSSAAFASADANLVLADPRAVFVATQALGGGAYGGALADNGGPVRTVALFVSTLNPALDTSGAATAPTRDARGEAAADQPGIGAESSFGLRDLGAYEAASPVFPPVTPPAPTPLTVTIPPVETTPDETPPALTPPPIIMPLPVAPDTIAPVVTPSFPVLPPVATPPRADAPGGSTNGDDAMRGGASAERMAAGAGNDTVRGLAGDDTLLGQSGDDVLRGGGGGDSIKGGGGADRLFGQRADDELHGGGGRDFLAGGAGADRIEGAKGADTLKGGGGADLFLFKPGDGADLIRDFRQGVDVVEFKRGVAGFDALEIEQRADDVLVTYVRGSILLENQNAADFGEEDFLF